MLGIAVDLLDQVQSQMGGHHLQWSLGGGTAMMLQIDHRESHDIDLFIDDGQLLGFLDPAKNDLHFVITPSDYVGDGARFQKFAFAGLGEIDVIVAGTLTTVPFVEQQIEGRPIRLEAVAEIVAKKIYYRGGDIQARDIFDVAAAVRNHRPEVVEALRRYPDQVQATARRIGKLNPEFVMATVSQLMITPGFRDTAATSLETVSTLLDEVLGKVDGAQ